MKLLARLYQTLILHPYFAIRTWWPLWFFVLNAGPRRLFRAQAPTLSPLGTRIVEDLRKNGIAVTSLEELAPGTPLLEQLQAWEREHPPVADTAGKKKFLREYWALVPELDLHNPFVSFALSDTVVDIVESYMDMWVRFKQYHLGKTLPDPERPLAGSQQWHRDPEEKRMCKMFIYLNDVDETAGPFTYLFGSTYGNKYGSLFPQKTPEGSYPSEEAVRAKGETDIHPMTGKAGTVMFCDTSGLHFGGRASHNERIMFTAAFASPLYSEGARYTMSNPAALSSVSAKQQYLLSGKRIRD